MVGGVQKKIEFDPHFPYTYIPYADWTHIAYVLGTVLPNIDCVIATMSCTLPGTCASFAGYT